MINCQICFKKINSLMLDMHTCRCKNIYCRTHIHNHNCNFNYHSLWKSYAEKELTKIENPKVAII